MQFYAESSDDGGAELTHGDPLEILLGNVEGEVEEAEEAMEVVEVMAGAAGGAAADTHGGQQQRQQWHSHAEQQHWQQQHHQQQQYGGHGAAAAGGGAGGGDVYEGQGAYWDGGLPGVSLRSQLHLEVWVITNGGGRTAVHLRLTSAPVGPACTVL